MAIRNDVTVDWDVSPRLLTVAAPSTEITVQDIVDTCRQFEDSPRGLSELYLIDAAGKEPLGGTVYVGITATLNNAYIAFEARPGPSWVLCIISGGNIVAIDAIGADLDPRYPTAYTTVDRTASSSATLQEQSLLEHSSFNGKVAVDLVNGYAGTDTNVDGNPIGTDLAPSNNWADALIIANSRGFTKFSVIGDAPVNGSNDFSDFEFIGQSTGKTLLTLAALANTSGVEIIDATITGTIDGENHIHNSIVVDLTYVNGGVTNCGLIGDIELSGDATFNDCYTVDQDDPPVIDMGGIHSLAMPNYSGLVTIKNLNDSNQEVGIGLNAGMVVIDSTVTAGTIIVSGVGVITDNSTGTVVVDTSGLISNTAIADAVWDEDLSPHIISKSASTAVRSMVYRVGSVTYDSDNGVPGTGFPTGSHFQPCDNLADALLIMGFGNVDTLVLNNSLTILASQNISKLVLKTIGRMGVTVVLSSGCIADQTTFRNVDLSGTFSGVCTTLIEDCSIGSLVNFQGVMNNVSFDQGVEIDFSSWGTIIQGTAGGNPTNEVEMSLNGAVVNISQWTGNLKIKDKTGTNRTVINCSSGNIIIDSTCIAGTIQLLGVGYLEADNSGPGCTVDTDGFVSNESISDTIWADDEAMRLLGLNQENQFIDQNVYDGNGHLTSARVRLYSSAGSVGTASDVIAIYTMTAVWSGDEMTSYKMVRV